MTDMLFRSIIADDHILAKNVHDVSDFVVGLQVGSNGSGPAFFGILGS